MPGGSGSWGGASGSWSVEDQEATDDGWHPLTSSNLSAYSYDKTSETLRIRFVSGRTYEYSDVPASVVSSLASAGSAGSYFNTNIRNSFSYQRM